MKRARALLPSSVAVSSLALSALSALSACGPMPVEYVDEPVYGTSATSSAYATTGGAQTVGYAAAPPTQQQVTIDFFQQILSPYGQWYDMQPWGLVFVPSDASYVPYREGHWEYTDAGMVWVSDKDWAAWTEHYGRWAYVDTTGWVWVPDTTWGPAWVEWRDAGTMVGWAPLGPSGWTTQVAMQYFVFVEVNVLFATDVWSYYAPPATVAWAYPNSSLVGWGTNAYGSGYCRGPSRDTLSRRGVSVVVSRPDPTRVGRVVPGGRPSVAVRGGDRPRVGVVSGGPGGGTGAGRPTVGVVGAARPAVGVNGGMGAAGRDVLAEDARRRWTESAARPHVTPPAGPTVQPSPIARETEQAEWAAGVRGGREASDAEVRRAMARAQEAERLRRASTPVRPLRPGTVTVIPNPRAPTAPPPTVTATATPPRFVAPAPSPAPTVAATPTVRFGSPSPSATPFAPAPSRATPTVASPPSSGFTRPMPTPPPRFATPTPAFGRPSPPPAVIAPPPAQAAPRFSAPAPSPRMNAPAPHVSAPAPRVSAPAPSRPHVQTEPVRAARPAGFAPAVGVRAAGIRR